ncbi:MAG: LysM peptidoglycan-binding domain-containing protein [Candidatus Coatesbacteria bacterium]|jgi:nucleoid-associated protein YgaU|nr:LysM peptidoglycan-binding domain-containing protein [Candidatus Coatesbacteria bacterium]
MKKLFPILLILLFAIPAFAQEEVELSDTEREQIEGKLENDLNKPEHDGWEREDLVEYYQNQAEMDNEKAQDISDKNDDLGNDMGEIDGLIADINSLIRDANNDLRPLPEPTYDSYVVVEGDCLWKIAEYHWGGPDSYKWPAIYDINTDLIKDPDMIYPGWELNIPREEPTM